MSNRTIKISHEMRKEISQIIQNELKDPRLGKLISVIDVDVTKDLKSARVFVSVLGDEDAKASALKGLRSASGFIRKEIGHRVQLRRTPELTFELDNSIEKGVYITSLINEVTKPK